jgi:hypothetical protein
MEFRIIKYLLQIHFLQVSISKKMVFLQEEYIIIMIKKGIINIKIRIKCIHLLWILNLIFQHQN